LQTLFPATQTSRINTKCGSRFFRGEPKIKAANTDQPTEVKVEVIVGQEAIPKVGDHLRIAPSADLSLIQFPVKDGLSADSKALRQMFLQISTANSDGS
jgi:hypothetical protein